MDIRIDFTILGVPSKSEADRITEEIRSTLIAKFNTDIYITWEDVSPFDTGDMS